MFGITKRPKRLDKELPLIKYHGFFRKQINMFQGVALIVGLTIGAGVLGIPYAVAKVGLLIGLGYIVGLGILMIGLNLMVGEIAVRTKGNLQLSGLSKKYLGNWGEVIMTTIKFTAVAGVMVIYIIGEGQTLSALFGGSAYAWSLIFFLTGSCLIYVGLKSIRVIDFVLSLGILFVVVLIAGFSAPHLHLANYQYVNFARLLLPYGVILFAYHGGSAVIEAHTILANRNKTFKYTIIIAGIISIITYSLFAFVVLGVSGVHTTEIATIGLGNQVGSYMLIFGNVFAVMAMATSFLTIGLSTRDSLTWDYKIPTQVSALVTCMVPLVVFLLGLRQFIMAINIVGGIFISLEMLLIILIYWKAKQKGDLDPGKYKLHHTLLLAILLIFALAVGAMYSVLKLF
ncbi:MAG: aromatic amino acid transport family protein [bacterium]